MGSETLAQGLAVSCNPCFIQVGARLGKQNFCDYFAAFGLRAATGIDLPGEIKRSEYYTADRMGPGGAGFLLLRAKQQGELPANDHSRLRSGQRRQAGAAPCGAVHPRC